MTGIHVNVHNFVRAETDRMFAVLLGQSGAVNVWSHNRTPTPLDNQPVIRMNRDTLYSMAVVDLRDGATLTLPDGGGRYVSAMVVNQDHYINRVLHAPGEHLLRLEDFDTEHVVVAVRILVDPADPDDVAEVNALQDQLRVVADSARPFTPPDYDTASLDATRRALLELAAGLSGFDGAFGARSEVDPVQHLLGTAAGWGGLPSHEATYVNVDPGLPVGEYALTVRDVPVDGFWSISLYNAAGYFEDLGGKVSVNNLTAVRDADGAVTVHFGGCGDGRPNCMPIGEGWNYLVRLYRPREEIVDGRWTFPAIAPTADGAGAG
jgi:hypothetical protein